MGGQGSGRRPSRKPPVYYRQGWLDKADARHAPVKAVLHAKRAIVQDIGGDEACSSLQHELAARAGFALFWIADMEARALQGEPLDVQRYGQHVDRLIKIAGTLGVQRKARELPTLAQYLEAKARAAEGDGDA